MALSALKNTVERPQAAVAPASSPSQPAWRSSTGAPAGASIVGDLQRDLEYRLTAPEPGKWSGRRTLVFIVGTCGLFWGVAAAALLAL